MRGPPGPSSLPTAPGPAARLASADLHQLSREAREHLRAAGTQVHIVLNPHSAPARPIDAGFHCHHRTLHQRPVSGLRQTRCLVYLEPDPMAETVPEQIPIAAVLNVAPREPVGIPSDHPGFNGRHRPLVRQTHDVIDLALLAVSATDDECPGDVRA